MQPDFIVRVPGGRRIVIEARSWEKSPGFRSHAAQQAGLIEEAAGADRAFVVVDGLERSNVPEGVVTLERLVPALQEEFALDAKPSRPKPRLRTPEGMIFAAMPFHSLYEDVYFGPMMEAARSVGAVCKRVDKEEYTGSIIDKMLSMIEESIAVIVDLSDSRPNVLYEAGYAHALQKPTLHICSTPLDELPFDVAQWNVLPYRAGQTHQLRSPLSRRLRVVLEQG